MFCRLLQRSVCHLLQSQGHQAETGLVCFQSRWGSSQHSQTPRAFPALFPRDTSQSPVPNSRRALAVLSKIYLFKQPWPQRSTPLGPCQVMGLTRGFLLYCSICKMVLQVGSLGSRLWNGLSWAGCFRDGSQSVKSVGLTLREEKVRKCE